MADIAYVALLRGINLAGRKTVRMADLCALCAPLGLHAPRTLLQSGNLVFRTGSRDAGRIERMLESAAVERLGLETECFVRSAAEWSRMVDGNPFPEEADTSPNHLVVVCLKEAPGRAGAAALQQAIVGRERARVTDRHAYLVYPDGIGRSKLTAAVVDRALGTRGTARNWNTVLKIRAALAE